MIRRLTPQQVATRFGVTVKRVYALIEAGRIVAIDVSIGNERPRWRIDEAAIEAFEMARSNRAKKQRQIAPASAR